VAEPPYKRGTILIPSGPAHDPDRRHLFVVCSDPCALNLVAIVPIETYTNDLCDQTCTVDAHEHAFIRHKSYVLYRNARTIGCDEVSRGLQAGALTAHDDMNGQTFLRIKNGMCRSLSTPRKIKAYLNCPPLAPAVIA
jgi:hypothetical protein